MRTRFKRIRILKESQANTARQLRRDMDLERAFVAADGLLLAGPDPVCINGWSPALAINTFADIEGVDMVFKDNAGYDTIKLLDFVKGHYGEY